MTEEQQLELSIQNSMQENIAASSPTKEDVKSEVVTQAIEPMEVADTGHKSIIGLVSNINIILYCKMRRFLCFRIQIRQ